MIDITSSINSAGTILTITATVKNESYYANVYIDTIQIDTQNTYVENGPSSNVIYTYTASPSTKTVTLTLTEADFLNITLANNLFFIYATATGTPGVDTPCGQDNIVSIGITAFMCPIYNIGLTYIKELNDDCNVSKAFVNFILRYKAFQLALITGNYAFAIWLWNKFINLISSVSTVKTCSCYG